MKTNKKQDGGADSEDTKPGGVECRKLFLVSSVCWLVRWMKAISQKADVVCNGESVCSNIEGWVLPTYGKALKKSAYGEVFYEILKHIIRHKLVDHSPLSIQTFHKLGSRNTEVFLAKDKKLGSTKQLRSWLKTLLFSYF